MRSRALRGLASSAEPRPLLEILGLASCAPWVQVRATYISAAMLTHPDRSSLPDASARMAELQQAWERYKRYAHREASSSAPGFTAFGVGCSFSDSREEQAERAALVEQAAHGRLWSQRQLACEPEDGG
tara:strand:+ start:70 stop:456 length:387 start_codon:yes stop_codon:yes gene_type:complete